MDQIQISFDQISEWMSDENFDMASTVTYSVNKYRLQHVCNLAARYGADVELDKCCEELCTRGYSTGYIKQFQSTRRPNPAKRLIEDLQKYLELDPDLVYVEMDKFKIKEAINLLKELSK